MDDRRPTDDTAGPPEEEKGWRPPTWVYLTLIILLVAVLLAVESVLNWLLPAR